MGARPVASSFYVCLGSHLLHWALVTRRTNVCIWLLALGSVACGGNTVATKPEPDPLPVATPDPQPQPEPTCEGPQPVCLQDCASLERFSSECLEGKYRCPNGWVDLDSCPKDACARRARNCCSPTGQSEYPECAADDTIGECPAGFEQRSPCVPAGLGLESCDDIADDSDCASEELICIKDRCGRNCRCEADLEGKLGWRCRVNAC